MKTILGLDYGTRKIGLAVSYVEEKRIALKLPLIRVNDIPDSVKQISKIIQDKNIGLLVIGYPLNSNFEKTKMCLKIDEFVELLKAKVPEISVLKVDETLTSSFARHSNYREGFKQKNVDSEVARQILQEFLDTKYT